MKVFDQIAGFDWEMPLRNLRSGATRTCFPPERRVPHSERARFVNLQRKNSAEKPKVQHFCISRLDSAITYNAGDVPRDGCEVVGKSVERTVQSPGEAAPDAPKWDDE